MSGAPEQVISDFKKAVNMTAHQLEAWLEEEESKKVGSKGEGKGESVGHNSGRRIVEILGKTKAEYDDDDLKHMAKVVGYVHRHLAQKHRGGGPAPPPISGRAARLLEIKHLAFGKWSAS